MYSSFLRCSVLISTLLSLVSAQQNVFYNPVPGATIHDYSKNPIYNIGKTVDLQWSTSYKRLSLVLWQNDNPINEYILRMYSPHPCPQPSQLLTICSIENVTTRTEYKWRVATNQNLVNGTVFFLVIYDESADNNGDSFSSHYFNLTQKATSGGSSTTKKPSSTMHTSIKSGTATTKPVSNTAAAATSTPTASSSDSGSSGLSTSAKVGLGVGIPVAVILGAAATWWFLSQRNRRRGAVPKTVDAAPMYQDQAHQEQKQ